MYGPWDENDGPSVGARELHAELRKEYLSLPELQRKAYEDVEASYRNLWDQMIELIRPAIGRLNFGGTEAEQNKAKASLFEKMKQEILDKADLDPYFALTREGDYRLSYQSNSKVYHQEGVAGEPVRVIEFFKTRAERESKILEIQSEILQSLSASVRADVMQIYALMTEHNISPEMTDSVEL